MKNILITGAAGFIGSHLVDRFIHEGYHIIAVDNLITGRKKNLKHINPDSYEFYLLDVSESIFLNTMMEKEIDGILHFASPASPIDFKELGMNIWNANIEGTENCLILANEKKCRFILASSSEVYGDAEQYPQKENYHGNVNTLGIRSVYDESKRMAESMTMYFNRQYHTNTGIARIFNTYGKRMRCDDGRVIPEFICNALQDKPLIVNGFEMTRSFSYIKDTVEGIVKLFKSDYCLPVNIGDDRNELTIEELAKQIIFLTSSHSEIIYGEKTEDDPRIRKPHLELAKNILGWEPTEDHIHSMHNTIEYFQDVLEKGSLN